MKKRLSLFLALVMVLTAVGTLTASAEGVT